MTTFARALTVLAKLYGVYFVVRLSYNLVRIYLGRRRGQQMLEGVPGPDSHPFWGTLPLRVKNAGKFHDLVLDTFRTTQSQTVQFEGPLFRENHEVMTMDPQNIKHILKDNVNNYVKMLPKYTGATNTNFLFKEWLGEGIFAVNHGDCDPVISYPSFLYPFYTVTNIFTSV